MANNTFIQVPSDVTDAVLLSRFLNKLVLEIDTAFGKRGDNAFTQATTIAEINSLLVKHSSELVVIEAALVALEANVNSINSRVTTIESGTQVVSVLANYSVGQTTEIVICKATIPITITLPDPGLFITSSRTKEVSITSAQSSIVTISPFSTELVVGEAGQYLVEGEVLNFITNGVDWYLGS